MLAWMTYVFVVTALLSVAAFAAERSARIRRVSGRWIWTATIVTSLLIPALIASVSIELPTLSSEVASTSPTPLRVITSAALSPAAWIETAAPELHSRRDLDPVLQRAWLAMSLVVFAGLLISAAHLYMRKRGWSKTQVNGQAVFVAPDIGPAVVGLLRPSIVVPKWLLQRPLEFQQVVLAHEQSHLDAQDQKLLAIALCLVVLMPWNLPLWWQLRRLRYAIEVDCDARVLKTGHTLAEYGETLIEVGQYRSGFVGAVAGMSESRSFLERRIALMTSSPFRRWRLASVGLVCTALAFVAVAASVSPPNAENPSASHLEKQTKERQVVSVDPAVLDRYVGHYQLAESMIVRIRRDGSKLMAQLTGQPEFEIFPESETKFFWKVVDAQLTFASKNGEPASAITLHQHGQNVPGPRIDDKTAESIDAAISARIKNQTPTPGSDAALGRLLDSVRAGEPNYEEMSAELAKVVQAQLPMMRSTLDRLGPVTSIEFAGVGNAGWDSYRVQHENGVSQWNILIDSQGTISGALLQALP